MQVLNSIDNADFLRSVAVIVAKVISRQLLKCVCVCVMGTQSQL